MTLANEMGAFNHILELGRENTCHNRNLNLVGSATSVTSVGSHSTTTTPVPQSGVLSPLPLPIFHISLIVPWFVLVSRFQSVGA